VSDFSLSARPANSRELACHLSTLRPYQVVHIPVDGRHIYSFAVIGATPGTNRQGSWNDSAVPRQMAIIWYRESERHFTLQYYPHQDAAQIVEKLPFSALGQAVDDLIAAGFDMRQPVANQPVTQPTPQIAQKHLPNAG